VLSSVLNEFVLQFRISLPVRNKSPLCAGGVGKNGQNLRFLPPPVCFRGHIKQCPIVELLLLMKLHVVAEFQKNGSETAEKVHWKKVNTRIITDWSLLRYTEGDHNQSANSQCHRPLI